jgi:glycosyltransferase involved in cell wall biosynthesis
MNPDSQRRLHVRRALLNKKNGANTQSFLCPLIQFAGVAKLHQRRLSDLLRHVICLHGILVDALAPLAGTFDFHLTVLGRDPQEDELKQRYFGSPWVTFGGFVTQEEVVRATSGHDLLCIPSILAENYPLAAAQALQLGTPVLGSNRGGIAELVRHEETGLLLPVGDVEAWRSAFQRVFTQPKLLQIWRNNALVHASEFAPELIARSFEDFISKL